MKPHIEEFSIYIFLAKLFLIATIKRNEAEQKPFKNILAYNLERFFQEIHIGEILYPILIVSTKR